MKLSSRSAYMGTIIPGTKNLIGLPRRYRKEGLLMRGNGMLRLETGGLRFIYLGMGKEIFIPADTIEGASTAEALGGRRPLGMRVLVVDWEHGGRVLSSGFALGKEDIELFRHYVSQMARRRAGRG